MKHLIFISLLSVSFIVTCNAQSWFELGIDNHALKANGRINAICADTNNNIYAAGQFTDSTSTSYRYVAKWDVNTHVWTKLGTGSNALKANFNIRTLCTDKQQNIYAAGAFTDDSLYIMGYYYVAKWDGTTWSHLGLDSNALNADGAIKTICADDSCNIYAAGNFMDEYGYNYVAKWNGTRWSKLGNLNANLFINSICVDDSFNVYAAGNFTDYTGNVYVAKYKHSTSEWIELGTSLGSNPNNEIINSIGIDNRQNVYVGLTQTDTVFMIYSNIYKWNDTTWNQLGTFSFNNDIISLCLNDSGVVYAGGDFTDTIGNTYVAKYNPHSGQWIRLDNDTNWYKFIGGEKFILTLCTDRNNNVYAAGCFTESMTEYNCYVAEFGKPNLFVQQINNNDINISVYPNPILDEINIKVDATCESIYKTYALYDYRGKVYLTGNVNVNNIIKINTLPTGNYLLKIFGTETTTFKIIKN